MGEERKSGRAGPRRPRFRPLRALLIAVAVLALALVAALLLVDTALVGDRLQAVVLPRLSKQLGRQVSVGELRVQLLPRPTVRAAGLKIAGTGAGPPLLEAREASFVLRLWPLARSLGREVQVGSLLLVGPQVNLVRGADGSWNSEGLAVGGGEREVVVDLLRVEDGVLRVVDLSERGDPAVALTRIAGSARGLGRDGPLDASLRAAFASGTENLALSVARSAQGAFSGSFDAVGVPVDAARPLMPAGLGSMLRGGLLTLRSRLGAEPRGDLSARGTLRLEGLSLRGTAARAGFDFQVASGRDAPGWRVEVEKIEVEGPAVSLRGAGMLQTEPLRGRLDLKGERLALDALLARQPVAEQSGGPLPESLRHRLERAELEATVAIGRVSSGALVATDLKATALLRSGVLELSRGSAGLYGGRIEVEKAAALLWQAVPEWKLEGRLEGVDLGRAMREVAGASPLEGRLGGALALRGAGNDWERLAQSLRGEGRLSLRQGAWSTLDIARPLADALHQALSRLGLGGSGLGGSGSGLETSPGTTLPQVELAFALREGALRLTEPVDLGDGWGRARLSGVIGLDRRVDLVGELFVTPGSVARLSGGRLRPRQPVEMPVAIIGTLEQPQVKLSVPVLAPSILERFRRRD